MRSLVTTRSIVPTALVALAVAYTPLAYAGHFGGRNQNTPGMKRSFDPDERASIQFNPFQCDQAKQPRAATPPEPDRVANATRVQHIGRGVAGSASRHRTANSGFDLARLFGNDG
ncbi:MAG: hypothetical protein AAF586_07300 [Planctomycetota bacterium]